MAYENSLNIVWNEAHQGARVPINDTGIPGAPSALNAALPEWTQGSINKAVYDTYIQHNEFDDIDKPDAENGTLDLLRCTHFVNRDMLWGFSGDARYKRPGDAMAFRGYPTGIVASHIITTETAYSEVSIGATGALDGYRGQYTVMSTQVNLQYTLPYNFQYTSIFKIGTTVLNTYEMQIVAGSLRTSHYRVPGNTEWILLPQGKVFFSQSMVGYSGDQTFSVESGDVIQVPFYGALDDIFAVVTEVEYNAPSTPGIVSSGSAYRQTSGIFDIDCYVNNCSEIREPALFTGNAGETTSLFIGNGGAINIGTSVWKDSAGTVPAEYGRYLWATFSYTYFGDVVGDDQPETMDIYRINQYIAVDSQGKITAYYTDINIGSAGCWINSACY